MMGESPTRPAIFQANPLVVVTPDISPFSFNARQLMVPYVGCIAICHAHASVASSTCGKASLNCFMGVASAARFWSIDTQLLNASGARKDSFQTSHAVLDFSVIKSSFW